MLGKGECGRLEAYPEVSGLPSPGGGTQPCVQWGNTTGLEAEDMVRIYGKNVSGLHGRQSGAERDWGL